MSSEDVKDRKIIIVGSGVFGLSTAYHLLQRGYSNVTVYDRSPILPAPDAASTDINKVVRSSYSDATYTRLAREAIRAWKNTEIWGDCFHESGVLIRGEGESSLSLKNDLDQGVRVKQYRDDSTKQDLINLFSGGNETPDLGPAILESFDGYLNLDGGWTHAQRAMELLLEHVRKLGGRVVGGKSVSGISEDGKGVVFGSVGEEEKEEERADLVVIATGSWTPCTFPDSGVADDGRVLATGQCIATIQLSSDEAARYTKVPVILDHTSGFYIFPPHTQTHIIKFATHCSGYTHTKPTGPHKRLISTPRTFITHDNDGGAIPRSNVRGLREKLKVFYPELGGRRFAETRVCWYADTPDSNWLIDFHPNYPNSVIFATGGSGHGFKFLPTLGRLVVDRIENRLEPELVEKFAFNRSKGTGAGAGGYGADQNRLAVGTSEMDVSDLCGPEDLLP